MPNSSSAISQAELRVGDSVQFRLVQRDVVGKIVEDRGRIGSQGRRLFRVQIPQEPEDLIIELPEGELQRVRIARDSPNARQITDFFKNGGLVAILQRNLAGGRNQPRVWLALDTRNNVTFTLEVVSGAIGGELVPFYALHDGKVFTGKRDAVSAFIRSFGLSAAQAEDVIAAVGTAP